MNLPFDRFIRRLTFFWILSLTGIGLLALSSDLLFGSAVRRSEEYADVVNLAGRQRTLSQQIALEAALYMAAGSDLERSTPARRLRQTVDTMRIEYSVLSKNAVHTSALTSVYNQGELPIANAGYWDAADALLAMPPDELSPDTETYRHIEQNSAFILILADQAVRAVLAESIAAAERLNQINDLRLIVIFAVLVAQFMLAFRPAVNRLRMKAATLEHEIAERKAAEAGLRASEARFRSLVETAPVGIFEADTQAAITWVNPRWEELMGLRGNAARGTAWLDAVHPDDRRTILAEAQQKLAAGQLLMVDYRVARRDGTTVTLHVTASPTLADNGQLTGYLGTVMDVTQRKLVEQQTLKLESERQRIKVLGEFIRDTSHDLRTPLAVIKSGLYLCLKTTDVERIHDKVTVIDEHVSYLTTVIDQLQEMAVLDTLTDLTLTPMYIAPLLRDAMNDLSLQAETAGKTAVLDLGSDLPPVMIAPDKLMEAIRAVMNNALRYTAPGGKITMSAALEGNYVVICVSDDGPGVAPEHIARVFERFYKVDKARGMGGGAGLGLPIAKRVIELHGGQISLESVVGEGTTVKMTLLAANHRPVNVTGA